MHFDGERFSRAPALAIEPIDTLGAGDAFIGRALFGLLNDESAEVLLMAAVDAASVACQSPGGFGHGAPLPSSDQNDEFSRDTVNRESFSREVIDADIGPSQK
jgi:sugar/nucleoside kinase (ribokinase family)